MRLLEAFKRQKSGWILAQMTAATLAIGVIDSITGYEVRLLPFYSGPIFVVAWLCRRNVALIFGLAAGFISLGADWISRDPDLMEWTRPWEVVRHITSCFVVAWVITVLKARTQGTHARIQLLEHSQRLEREIVHISEEEQRRIGQDLHDGLCQELAALSCAASSLQADLEKSNLKDESSAAANLSKLLRDAVVQARDLAHELVPAHVAQVGLVLALESLAESVARSQKVECSLEVRGDRDNVTEEEAGHLYRIAQEAINNATRHGKATKILISLHNNPKGTTLQILDDGVGLAQTKRQTKSIGRGMGLNIMRYRARQTGNELEIVSPTTGGTLVSCRPQKLSNGHETAND
jgi:signal transduction histidine kinase